MAGPSVTTLISLNETVDHPATLDQRLRGFKLLGYTGSNAVGIHAGVNLISNLHFEDIWIENFTGSTAVGLWVDNLVTLLFENCYLQKNNLNVLVGSTSPTSGTPTTIHFVGGAIREATTHGVFISSGNSIRFSGTVIEYNYASGVTAIAGPYPVGGTPIDPTARTPGGAIRDVLIENDCWLEGNWRNYSTSTLTPPNFVYDVVIDGSRSYASCIISNAFFSHGTSDVGRKSLHIKSALASLSNMRCQYGFPYEIVVEGGSASYVQLVSDSADRMARFVANLDGVSVIYPRYAPLVDLGNGFSRLPS